MLCQVIFDISYNSSKKVKSILANANKDDICSLKYLCYKSNTFSSFFSKLRCNNEKISHPKNTKILLTAFLKDQIVRGVDKKLLLDKYFNYNIKIDSTSLLSFTEEDNTKLLKKIINKFGFPRISQIGRDGMLPTNALTDRLVNNVYGVIDRDFIKTNFCIL